MKKLLLSLACGAACLAAPGQNASAQLVYGLSGAGASFVTFNSSTPGTVSAPTVITGLNNGETIASIDFRPSNQFLYGYSSTNRLYSIATGTGAATFVSAFGTVDPTVPTPGTTAGVGSDVQSPAVPVGAVTIDVNPNVPAGGTVGALRIVSFSGGNTRYAFASDTLFRDDTLTFSGGVPSVVGVAYTNSDVDPATGTALYYLEASTDSLYTTAAPNDGTLLQVGTGLGFDVPNTGVGFDIQLLGGTGAPAFASINGNFYSINLAAGTATNLGAIGGLGITDIAVVPESETVLLLLAGLCAVFFFRRRQLAA